MEKRKNKQAKRRMEFHDICDTAVGRRATDLCFEWTFGNEPHVFDLQMGRESKA